MSVGLAQESNLAAAEGERRPLLSNSRVEGDGGGSEYCFFFYYC